MRIGRRCAVASLGLAMIQAHTARAVDGVLEINQTCAVSTGCFAGDAAGFPVRISSPGSYVLTSDLAPPSTADAIDGADDDVTLDLNGFALRGTGAGSRRGIQLLGAKNWEVRNGILTAFEQGGIQDGGLGSGTRLIDLRFSDNGFGALLNGNNHSIIRCQSIGDAGLGFAITGQNGTIRDSKVVGSAGAGISTGASSHISGNVVRDTTGVGSHGIAASSRSIVLDNTVTDNAGFGIVMSDTTSGYGRNVVNGNATGTVFGGTEIGGNVCDGNATCP